MPDRLTSITILENAGHDDAAEFLRQFRNDKSSAGGWDGAFRKRYPDLETLLWPSGHSTVVAAGNQTISPGNKVSSNTHPEAIQKRSPCSACAKDTKHYVRAKSERRESDDEEFWSSEVSLFLECAGCGTTSVRKTYSDASMSGPEDATVQVFPPRLPRQRPAWLWKIDPKFRPLLGEIYNSLGTGAAALPVMGARTIMDMVIADKVGDQGTFKDGLDALENRGLLSRHDRTILDAAIEAGNAAAHRGFEPKPEDVDRVVEIVEHLLNALYVLKDAAETLKRNTPPRPPRSKQTQ